MLGHQERHHAKGLVVRRRARIPLGWEGAQQLVEGVERPGASAHGQRAGHRPLLPCHHHGQPFLQPQRQLARQVQAEVHMRQLVRQRARLLCGGVARVALHVQEDDRGAPLRGGHVRSAREPRHLLELGHGRGGHDVGRRVEGGGKARRHQHQGVVGALGDPPGQVLLAGARPNAEAREIAHMPRAALGKCVGTDRFVGQQRVFACRRARAHGQAQGPPEQQQCK